MLNFVMIKPLPLIICILRFLLFLMLSAAFFVSIINMLLFIKPY